MAKVKLLKNCYVDNKACKKGDVVETSRAQRLIGANLAEVVVQKAKAEPKAKSAPTNRKDKVDETR